MRIRFSTLLLLMALTLAAGWVTGVALKYKREHPAPAPSPASSAHPTLTPATASVPRPTKARH